jgi:hypothetical protein
MFLHNAVSLFASQRGLARVAMAGNALFLIVLGFSVLTAPAMIPVAVGLWLGAAAMMALGILTPLDE